MDWRQVWETVNHHLATFGLKAVGAVAVWIVGRWLISLALRLLARALTRQEVDSTLQRYVAKRAWLRALPTLAAQCSERSLEQWEAYSRAYDAGEVAPQYNRRRL